MKLFRHILTFSAIAVCGAALAQYQWIDKDGRKIFSDRPPPAEVPAKNVLKQPRGASPISPVGSTPGDRVRVQEVAAPAVTAPASAPGIDKGLEEKKKQAEAAEAAKKKEEERKLAALRAENCRRAQSAKGSLDSGVRVARTNDKGEREILDEAGRSTELQRAQSIIQSDCS